MAYVFWAAGTLLFLTGADLLLDATDSQLYIVAIAIAVAAVGMWLGIKRITR
jgi:hypothetical protein